MLKDNAFLTFGSGNANGIKVLENKNLNLKWVLKIWKIKRR
jgi:hypothetical protein